MHGNSDKNRKFLIESLIQKLPIKTRQELYEKKSPMRFTFNFCVGFIHLQLHNLEIDTVRKLGV